MAGIPDDEAARVQVDLRTQLAAATPLRELRAAPADLSRVQPLLEQLASAVASLLDTDLAVVWTSAADRPVLLPSAWVGFPDDYVSPLEVPYGTGSAGRAVLEGAVVLVEDVATSEHYGAFRQGALDHGVRTVLSVPMVTLGGEAVGCLSTYYREPFSPQQRDLELAETYARQAAEIVERARLHAEARELALLEQRRGQQLRALADSALAMSAADSLDELLRLVTEAAVSVIGCHQGVCTRLPTGWADATTYVSLSERYAQWRSYDVVPRGLGVLNAVTRENRVVRLTGEQLQAHPEYRGLRDAPGHPPLPDYLAAPLIGRDGSNLGLVQLAHKLDDTAFTADDEAILVQLAQMASSTLERIEAFAGERAARQEAEQAAQLRGLLSEASAAFAESFDPQGIAQALVDVAVPRLAELAVLHVVDEAGDLVLAACAATGQQARARAFFGAAPVLPGVPLGPAAVLATGAPQVLDTTDRVALRSVCATDGQAAELGAVLSASAACLPLTARGRTVGVLTVSRTAPYGDADVDHALDLARRAALALDNANRYAFERDLAVTLQRSLLPRAISPPAGLSAAARYLPGAQGTQVGGDWYDLLEVDGSVVLVVGDVMGRGVPAAALMGQLRATTRAYALEGHGPAEVLQRLDAVVLSLTGLHFTTCVVGVLDPVARTLCLASAGHLPPVVVGPDGGARAVELDPGLPLGVGGGHFEESSVQLEPGSMVLLYTDGLVETRSASVEDGLATLLACLGDPVGSADAACERVLAAMGAGESDDDTALLVLRLDPVGAPDEPLLLCLPPALSAPATARAAVARLLQGSRVDADVAELLVSELVANAVRHTTGGDVVVRAGLADGVLRVEVHDDSPEVPGPVGAPAEDSESGRGLLLVDVLADRWGVDEAGLGTLAGKRVWFELGAT